MTSPAPFATRPLGVAAIGYAFMGQAHSHAWRTVAKHFGVLEFEQNAQPAAETYRGKRRSGP